MPTSEQIFDAMRKADAAGDQPAIEQLKQMYLEQQAAEGKAAVPPADPNAASAAAQPKGVPAAASAAGGVQTSAPAAQPPSWLNAPQEKTLTGVVSDVAQATGVGAAVGAASPEIVQGAGKALQMWGPGRAAGMYVEEVGRGMRLHRASMAVNGALSGAVSEGAGQAAEAGGLGPKAAMGVRIGAGVATPMVGAGALKVVEALVPVAVRNAWAAVVKVAGTERKLAESAIAQAKNLLSGNRLSTAPQHTLHDVLQKGVQADLEAAEVAAKQVIADAHTQAGKLAQQDERAAQQLVAEAQQKAAFIRDTAKTRAAVLDRATAGQVQRSQNVLAQAEPELQKIGTPYEVSDIGKALRDKVRGEQKQLLQQREVIFKQLKQQRDTVVQQREAAGQFVDSVPAMKSLKQEIAQKLLLTKPGRAAAEGKAAVTEPGVMRAYQSIYDAVANRRVQTGVNEAGNPTYETFKTTFEALDHVRRKLGDAGWGKPGEEGYGALGQGIAKDMYGKIGKIQQDYVGGDLQSRLQGVYAEGSDKLQKFGTASGRKMTAVDRVDPEVFAKDPAAVPKAYFQSQQGVRDLLELTGDPKLVVDAAGSFAARSVAGMNAQQVGKWAQSNSDWLREIPGLQGKLSGYASKLQTIERYSGDAAGRVAGVQKAKNDLLQGVTGKTATAETEGLKAAAALREGMPAKQTAVLDAGGKAAQLVRQEAEARAAAVLPKGDSPPDVVRKLLTGSSLDGLKHTTRYIAGNPGGKKALEGSVRNLLAQESPKQIAKLWNERLYEVIKEGQLLDKGTLTKLDTDVQRVLRSEIPESEKQRLVQKMFAGATATTAVTGVAAGKAIMRKDGAEAP